MEKNLTQFQKSVIEALESEGYIKKYDHTYTYGKNGFCDINVAKIKNIQSLIRAIYDCGRTDKLWSIQRVLGIS